MIAIEFYEAMSNFEVITALTLEQREQLYKLFVKEWWTSSRTFQDVCELVQHSLSIALVDKTTKTLIAYARVVTDYYHFACIFDVIVDVAFRKKQIGKNLMEAVIGHHKLKSVEKFELRCLPELVPFYTKCGFTVPKGELVTMTRGKL